MIFVAVGNARQGFRRLVQGMDQLAGRDAFGKEAVVVQLGHEAGYVPRHCEWRRFFGPDEFADRLRAAQVVVTHAGYGTLREVLRFGKTPVVMPRRKQFGEHVDDHQLDVVQAYGSMGLVIPAYVQEELAGAIAVARTRLRRAPVENTAGPLVDLVATAIDEFADRSE